MVKYYYKIKFKTKKTVVTTPRYGKKRFVKGRTYTVRRKLTPTEARIRHETSRLKILSVKRLKRRKK